MSGGGSFRDCVGRMLKVLAGQPIPSAVAAAKAGEELVEVLSLIDTPGTVAVLQRLYAKVAEEGIPPEMLALIDGLRGGEGEQCRGSIRSA